MSVPVNEPTARESRLLLLLILMCSLVCGGVWASTQLSLAVGTVSSIWISNGIISAFALTVPRPWRFRFLVAGQLSGMGVDLVQGDTFGWACCFVVCNSAEVLLTVLALGHFATRSDITSKRNLCRIGLFGLVLGPLTCSVLASPASHILEGRSFFEAIRIWFLSGALGSASTLPLILFLRTGERRKALAPGGQIMDLAYAILFAAIVLAVFWQTRYPLIFLLFPPLIATLFRFRLAGAVYGTSLILIVSAAFTALGHGPFALSAGSTPTERVMLFQIFGLILFSSCVPLGFSIEERNWLEQHLKQANETLAALALLDPLTGVHNRRSFDASMKAEWSRACVEESPLSMVYLDIDFFKKFNDTYGHQSGDECLRSVAGCLMAGVRGSSDCVARYGGEEFVVLLPETTTDSARATAERIAERILALGIPHTESSFGVVTASFGIATATPSRGGEPAQLIRLADEALYTAKLGGRGRIETNLELSLPLA